MKLLFGGKEIYFEGKEIYLTGIHFDSRQIKEGYLFVAIIGIQTDGHNFIEEAIKKGAKTIVCQTLPDKLLAEITYIQVKNSIEALGCLASLWYGRPSEQLCLVGITGTNGKTTVATLLYELFKRLGHKVGLISTICNCINNRVFPTMRTTPDIITINHLLAQMVSKGCQYAFMEISSHGIDQKRIFGLHFKGGVFTNLTRDHLDYHETFKDYRNVKKSFFDSLHTCAFALTNKDDKNGIFMLQNTKAKKQTYSFLSLSDFKGKVLELHLRGTLMEIDKKEIFFLLTGKFNAYNLLAVYGTAVLLGKSPDDICVTLSSLHPAPGRFETFSASNYTIILDYAHTPDALKNVLNTILDISSNRKRKIITVIGCGGNRDKGKRPMMAKEAVQISQQVLLTSDNPRFENPISILKDMIAGVSQVQRKKILCIIDRKKAIHMACSLASCEDVVLIAGKGHENYQEVQGIRYPFDDKKIIEKIVSQTN